MRPQDVGRFNKVRIEAGEAHRNAKKLDETAENIRRESARATQDEGAPVERFDNVWGKLVDLIKAYPMGSDFVSGNTDIHIVTCSVEDDTEDYGIWFNISGQENLEQPNRRIEARWMRYGELEHDPADFIEVVVRDNVVNLGESDPKTIADLGNMESTLKAYLESDRVVELPGRMSQAD